MSSATERTICDIAFRRSAFMCRNHRVVPSLGLLAGVLAGFSAHAQQVIADGDEQTPAAGEYRAYSSDAAPVFHALNGGSIIPSGSVNLYQWGDDVPAVRVEGSGSRVALEAGSIYSGGSSAPGISVGTGGYARLSGVHLETRYSGAVAVAVDGEGSRVVIEGGSIQTNGRRAHGISVGAGAVLQASGTRITVSGESSSGVLVEGGDVALEDLHIQGSDKWPTGPAVDVSGGLLRMRGGTILAGGGHALNASGGTSTLDGVLVELPVGPGEGIMVAGTAHVMLRDVRIVEQPMAPSDTDAIRVQENAKVTLDRVAIDLSDENRGFTAKGLSLEAGATATVNDSRIDAGAGAAIESYNGTLVVADSELSGAVALVLGSSAVAVSGSRLRSNGPLHRAIDMRSDGSRLSLHDSSVYAIGNALGMTGADNHVDVVGSRLEASEGEDRYFRAGLRLSGERSTAHVDASVVVGGTGVSQSGNTSLDVRHSELQSTSAGGAALWQEGGVAKVHESTLRASGTGAAGLWVDGRHSATPQAEVIGSWVETTGDDSPAVVARDGGTAHLQESAVVTRGAQAHGVLAAGTGEIVLHDTHVLTEGEGSWAAVVNDGGRLQIDGGSLVSQQHGAAWIRSMRDAGLALGKGALLYGGNGSAVQLDAAVAGRFDLALAEGARMQGDIVINPDDLAAGRGPQSELHVRLSEGSLWVGRSDRLHGVTLDSGSQWTLTGDTAVKSLRVNGSGLALSDGRVFNTLTVAGDLDTTAATFLFNGALQGDGSMIDRLHVRGDAWGDAQVMVNNVGGLGAQTLDGIELIRVDGASLARYTLAGRAVAGTYEYFLHKGGVAGGEGNWYLRSELPTTPDPCQVDPSLPDCTPIDPIDPVDPITPPRLLRPEAGAYLANQSAAINMFSHRLNDRIVTVPLDEGRAAWARVGRQQADFSAVGGQLSIDGNTSVLQIGSDLVRRGNAAFGVMLGTGRADSSAVSDLTGYNAKGRVRGSAVGVYGTWLQAADGTQGAYMDANLQYGRFDNRVQGIGLAPEHYDSRMASASLEAGYTFNVWQGSASALYVQPQLQLSQVDFRADRHVESNGTVIDQADAGGLSGRLGVRVFGHGTAAGNAVQPYLAVNWLRGSGTSALQFNGDTLGADMPRNRYEVQAGAELKLGQRWGAWGGVSVQRGDHGYRNVGGQLGLRKAW
ncbi:autotransporter outer membrane beta-barrel domain-containing protein [uncultured Stenotrophomonas sp.]|uniref:autotransporter family protein n=1 Tax=uncultured Stenotrophomonas sp. TaxID=165438 RepID=UPI002582B03A|nr:autotransporter outer membrane beta-barrel domain-containing protein [uncultured Stenotrophomonas sp.]